MKRLLVSAAVLAVLVVGARTYDVHQHQAPGAPNPASTSVTDGSDNCDKLTKLFRDKGYTVDQCVTENTVPDHEQPQHVAHTWG